MFKTCPFCGGSAKMYCRDLDERYGYGYIATVSCNSCGASVSECNKEGTGGWNNEESLAIEARAVEKWNKRT